MNMKNVLLAVFGVSVFALAVFAQTVETKVSFSGDWEEGVTLFSPNYLVDGQVFGRDVFPVADSKPQRVRVCEQTGVKTVRHRVCEKVIYDSIKTCYLDDGNVEKCTERNFSRDRSRRFCEYVTEEVPVESCRYEFVEPNEGVLCVNPDGTKSNVLKLENFEMSVSGGSWEGIPYENDDVNAKFVSNEFVKFRVNIPSECTPEYDVDNAVTIKE